MSVSELAKSRTAAARVAVERARQEYDEMTAEWPDFSAECVRLHGGEPEDHRPAWEMFLAGCDERLALEDAERTLARAETLHRAVTVGGCDDVSAALHDLETPDVVALLRLEMARLSQPAEPPAGADVAHWRWARKNWTADCYSRLHYAEHDLANPGWGKPAGSRLSHDWNKDD